MFYLKYRPKSLSQIDNSKVKQSLINILGTGEIPHAFLFVGPKGTGKTSGARILAKSLNCLKRGKDFEPCNSCSNCRGIEFSSSIDVIEMDAASNRGIEDIKNLIKESNFLPMSSKYRIFIIDEAHMITTEAFNALLKTLEEPPESVIFVLATTNEEKLPKTIKSRCFFVNFGKAKKIDVENMLKRIAVGEKLKLDDKVISLIVKQSDFSFRDAAKLLEELTIQNKLELEEAKKFLGVFQQNFLKVIAENDFKKALAWLDEFDKSGGSFKGLIEQLLEELRIVLLSKNGIEIESENELNFSVGQTVKLIKLFTEAYNGLKISPIESLPLEIAVVQFYASSLSDDKKNT